MSVGIHLDPHKGKTTLLECYEKILSFNGIEYIWLDINRKDFWDKVKGVDLFIYHYSGTERQHQLAKALIPIIEEELKIRCFPDIRVSWLYDDKVKEYYFLKEHGVPVIPAWIFWSKIDALKWLENAELPIVFKLSGGASSENVVLVKNRLYGRRLIRRMFGHGIISGHIPGIGSMKWKNMFKKEHMKRYGGKIKRYLQREEVDLFGKLHRNYIFFQKYLPNNKIDTRIHIIGNRAFGDIRYVRPNDFRASGSGNFNLDPSKVNVRCIEIAFNMCEKLSFESMAVDFLFDHNNNPLVNEISYTQPDWAIWEYPGYWDKQLNWHGGNFCFPYLVIMDMLGIPDLKQPDLRNFFMNERVH